MNRMERKSLSIADDKRAMVEITDDWAFWAFGLDPAVERAKPNVVKDPDKTYCTYCGREVDQVDLTLGRGKPRVTFTDEVYRDPDTQEISSHRKMHVVSERIYACPDCCLNIRKPITVTRV